MKLKSMELPKKTKAELKPQTIPSYEDREKYPWGLKINCDNEILDLLGLNIDSMKIGETVTVEAKAEIMGLAQTEEKDRKRRRRMEIQITHMAIEGNSSLDGGFKGDQEGKA